MYERKDHASTATILFDAPVFRWNPETVDLSLSRVERKYFLESSKRLVLKGVDVTDFNHRPFFLSSYGEWEGSWNKKDKFVCDYRPIHPEVDSGSTYLSRRAQNKPPEGYTWMPFSDFGEFIVTLSCISPFRNPKITFFSLGGRDIISVDGSVPIEVDMFTVEKRKIVGYNGFPAETLTLQSSPDDDFCYHTRDHGYLSPSARLEVGLSWDPGAGAFVPSLMGTQTLRSLPVFDAGPDFDVKLIDVTDLPPGFYCVAASRQNLRKVIPGFAPYLTKRWIGREDWSHLPIEAHDGGYGGGDMVAAQIIEYLSLRPKRDGLRIACASSFEIASVLNTPIRTIEQYCYRLPDIFQWRQVQSGSHEWIRRLDLDMRLPDGSLTYLRALEILTKTGKVSCRGSFGHFHTLMLLNGIMVKLKMKNGILSLYRF